MNNEIPELVEKHYLDYRNITNIYLETDVKSNFLRLILQDFINTYENIKGVWNNTAREFFKTFQKSLQGTEIDENNWFSMSIFEKQYKFYKELSEQIQNENPSKSFDNPRNRLIAFYRFITNESCFQKYKSDFTKAFIEAINNKTFYKYYESGFIFVYYDSYSECPKEDKICILPNKITTHNADTKNYERKGLDFSLCNDRYKQDLKNFMWANLATPNSLNQYAKLVEFLNLSFKEQYSNNIVQFIKSNKEFSEEFLWNYRIKVQNQFENTNNVKSIFKLIRRYLKYYSKKYQVCDSDIDIFSLKGLERSDGGNIITEKDINLIYKRFKEKEKLNEAFKIYTIVFELFFTTKIRIGEILNLQRNYLPEINNEPCILKYIKKTSNKCFVDEAISKDSAQLIFEASELTKDIVEPNKLNSEYIFVEKYVTNHISKCKKINFEYEFKKIIDELKEVLDKTDYRPNNIRHTFINNVYVEGRKQGMSIQQMASVAGNSYKTANKHYRDSNDLLNYLEATNGICIAEVDVKGKIYASDDNMVKNEVNQGLGKCVSTGCKFEIGECLICNNFVTFTNREKNFELKIREIDNLISGTNDNDEVEELVAYKKVLVRYLYEIKNTIVKEAKKNG